MSKRMTKRTRSLLYAVIALVAVAVLLVGLLLLLPEKEQDPDDDTSVDESVVLLDKTADKNITVSSATISLAGSAHTFSRAKDGLYTLKGYDDLPLDQTVFESVADTLLNVTASRLVVENPENPLDFGFGKAQSGMTVTATYSDGTSFSFEIGDLSPSKDTYYLREVGKTTIYLIESSFRDELSYEPVQYLNWSPIVAPEAVESTDTVVVRDVTLSGAVRPKDIFFQITAQPKDDEDNMVISG